MTNPPQPLLILQVSQDELTALIETAVHSALSRLPASQVAEEYLTRADVAQLFKVTLATINTWSKGGKLKRHYLGHKVFFLRSEVEEIFLAKKRRIGPLASNAGYGAESTRAG